MSKKLQGNGLWESSRMMLPQHKEQSLLLHSDTPAAKSEPPTRMEMDLMRDCIILPVALQIVEKKRLEVDMSSQTLKLLYSVAARVLSNHIREDVQKARKALWERNIRIAEESKDHEELVYCYSCRGHENRLTMTKDFMRDEVSARIGGYVNKLVLVIQEARRSKE